MRSRTSDPITRRKLSTPQIGGDLSELGDSRFEIFDDFLSDDVGVWKIGAVFEAFVFQAEPSRWEASETDGRAERPTECGKRRSQDVEVQFIALKRSS
jgi:hypothetical protein